MRRVRAGEAPHGRRPALFLFVLIALVSAIALLAACGEDDSSDAAGSTGSSEEASATGPADEVDVGVINDYTLPDFSPPAEKKQVILLQAHRSDAFAISSAKAVEEFGAENNLEVTVNDAGGYQEVSKQIDQIEAAILEKPDALIVWSTDPAAVVPALEKARKAGITVVGYTQPPAMDTEFVVTGDFTLDGETMASSLFERMGGTGQAMLVLGGAGSAYQAALQEGWDTALEDYPDIEVVAEQTIPDFDPSKVQSAVENELVRSPNLAGVMTTTTAMAAAASDAFAAAGKDGYSVGQILGGCDQIKLLQDDQLAIVLGVPAVHYGELVVANTIRSLNGEPVDKTTVVPGNVYTPDNIDEAPLDQEIAPEFREGCS